jgi:hypothetical protein
MTYIPRSRLSIPSSATTHKHLTIQMNLQLFRIYEASSNSFHEKKLLRCHLQLRKSTSQKMYAKETQKKREKKNSEKIQKKKQRFGLTVAHGGRRATSPHMTILRRGRAPPEHLSARALIPSRPLACTSFNANRVSIR